MPQRAHPWSSIAAESSHHTITGCIRVPEAIVSGTSGFTWTGPGNPINRTLLSGRSFFRSNHMTHRLKKLIVSTYVLPWLGPTYAIPVCSYLTTIFIYRLQSFPSQRPGQPKFITPRLIKPSVRSSFSLSQLHY